MASKPEPGELKPRSRKRGDRGYLILVSILASTSAAFPFYVHFHPEKFAPPMMTFRGSEELSAQLDTQSAAYKRTIATQVIPRLELDRIVTGGIQRNLADQAKSPSNLPPPQPFPDEGKSDPNLKILHASSGRLLAVDGGRIVALREGSLLSDGSKITSIYEAVNGWTVQTSSGLIVSWKTSDLLP